MCRRAIKDPIYNISNVHLLPGYPNQNGSDLLIAFYVLNPAGSNSSVLPGIALIDIADNSKSNISMVIGHEVIKLERLIAQPSTKKHPVAQPFATWKAILIGVSCAVLVLIVIVVVVILYSVR